MPVLTLRAINRQRLLGAGDFSYNWHLCSSCSSSSLPGHSYFIYIAGFAGMMVMAQAAALKDALGDLEPAYGNGYLDYAVALGTVTLVAALVMYALIYTVSVTGGVNLE